MTNEKMATNYIFLAGYKIELVKKAFQDEQWAVAVRQAQECIELCLKGVLRFVGIEPPKWHDVGKILKDNKNKFPSWFEDKIDIFAHYSLELGSERQKSFYGDEDFGLSPQDIFSKIEASEALKAAEEILAAAQSLAGIKKKSF